MNVKAFTYKEQTISQRQDGYLNASQMCKVNHKKLNDWIRNKSTLVYIDQLAIATGITAGTLVYIQNGIETWVHPSLAINLARWISAEFAVWCDAHIFNLMSCGKTTLDVDPLAEMKLKLELLKAEKDVAVAQKNLLDTRSYIVTALPEPIQQKVLGYQVVKEIEKVEVVIDKASGKQFDGVGITYIAKSLGFKTNQQCWAWLEQVGFGKDSDKWHNELTAINTPKLDRDDFQYLKDILKDQTHSRQLWLGE